MKKLFLYISLIIFSASCTKDIIELDPYDNLNAESVYKTKDDFNQAVLSAYQKLQSQVSIVYFEMVEWRSDDLDLSAPTSGTQDRYDINKFVETSANSNVENAWASLYNGILRCNTALDKLPGADFDESYKLQYEGELRFVRAMHYFNAVRFWGGVQLVLSVKSAEETLSIGRSTEDEVYAAIIDDLKFAAENLPASYSSSDFGRATSGAATALLGKVYLTLGEYANAATTLSSLIGTYSLQTDIADVFDDNNKDNSEIIFSVRFYKDDSDEDHGLWFGITDVSTSPITSKLTSAYASNDARKAMIDYVQIGNYYVPGKYQATQSTITNNYGNDFIILRYADILLMYAEAVNENGYSANTTTAAWTALNEVRTRAGLTAYTATDLPDQTSFREAVWNERFLEFPLEGQRWFDLKRTETAANNLSDLGISFSDYQYLYPIPQSEIEVMNNTDIFWQNTGY